MFIEKKIPHLSLRAYTRKFSTTNISRKNTHVPDISPRGKKAKLLICRFLTAPSSVYMYFPFRQILMNALTAMVFANELGLYVKTDRALTVAFAKRVFSWTVTEEHVQVKDHLKAKRIVCKVPGLIPL